MKVESYIKKYNNTKIREKLRAFLLDKKEHNILKKRIDPLYLDRKTMAILAYYKLYEKFEKNNNDQELEEMEEIDEEQAEEQEFKFKKKDFVDEIKGYQATVSLDTHRDERKNYTTKLFKDFIISCGDKEHWRFNKDTFEKREEDFQILYQVLSIFPLIAEKKDGLFLTFEEVALDLLMNKTSLTVNEVLNEFPIYISKRYIWFGDSYRDFRKALLSLFNNLESYRDSDNNYKIDETKKSNIKKKYFKIQQKKKHYEKVISQLQELNILGYNRPQKYEILINLIKNNLEILQRIEFLKEYVKDFSQDRSKLILSIDKEDEKILLNGEKETKDIVLKDRKDNLLKLYLTIKNKPEGWGKYLDTIEIRINTDLGDVHELQFKYDKDKLSKKFNFVVLKLNPQYAVKKWGRFSIKITIKKDKLERPLDHILEYPSGEHSCYIKFGKGIGSFWGRVISSSYAEFIGISLIPAGIQIALIISRILLLNAEDIINYSGYLIMVIVFFSILLKKIWEDKKIKQKLKNKFEE